MANFEGLIRQALASQNASDPATRQRIYQSSRNALVKMLEKSGKTGDQVVRTQFGLLENSIALIEAEYVASVSARHPSPAESASSSVQAEASLPEDYQPAPLFPPIDAKPQARLEPIVPEIAQPNQPEPTPPAKVPRSTPASEQSHQDKTTPIAEPKISQASAEDPHIRETYQPTSLDEFTADQVPPPTYQRKNPLLRRIWPIFLALAVLAVALWILYALFVTRLDDTATSTNNDNTGENSQTSEEIVITLLQPTDLSALVTTGRGSAELITQQKQQMLRIKSIRQGGNTGANAEPILLKLEKGVLRQISGQDVTVEFFAKSGGSGPAQFAVQCDIGGVSACGRKRFRIGLQPERILFKLDLQNGISTDQPAYLAINTDITNAAEVSGNGDAIDLIHVRLRFDKP